MESINEEDQEMIREFLVESHENLSRLDQDLVELEKRPNDTGLLSSIFRTIHTIKGACGFLAFTILEAITHKAETLLSQLRDGQRALTPGDSNVGAELGNTLAQTQWKDGFVLCGFHKTS